VAEEEKSGDEVVTVTLPRRDYVRLRKMLERDAVASGVWKWVQSVGLVAIGGVIAIAAFGGVVRDALSNFLGIGR
jgi:hypothetical protein